MVEGVIILFCEPLPLYIEYRQRQGKRLALLLSQLSGLAQIFVDSLHILLLVEHDSVYAVPDHGVALPEGS